MKANIDGTTYSEKKSLTKSEKPMPTTSDLTLLFKHGGIHSILDPDALYEKVEKAKVAHPSLSSINAKEFSKNVAEQEENLFFRIVDGDDKKYNLNSALISHITLYGKGRTFSQAVEEIVPNKNIPTILTFVGQFVDHDLTLNMIDLIGRVGNRARPENLDDPNPPKADDSNNPDIATPFIDLDSVYGPRSVLANPGDISKIIDKKTGKFFLKKNEEYNYYDFCRDIQGKNKGIAYINDRRNDENQLISQIHLLIIRLHNTIVSSIHNARSLDPSAFESFPKFIPDDENSVTEFVNAVRKEVVRTWQSFLWNDYLPKLINSDTLKEAIQNAKSSPKPTGMPHEFSISFRMGHSQLRPSYRLNPDNTIPIPLFANEVLPNSDLRGGCPLPESHVIDWHYFLDEKKSVQTSNKIDGKVTSVVFNLPEAAIPDNVKGVTNLPQRNLMRSEQVRLAAGEDLAAYYNIPDDQRLTPDDIEPDPYNQKFFMIDNDGQYEDTNRFRTPLWYYVLKEAELLCNGEQLGPVGGRIIGQVIAAAIWHQDYSFINLNGETWTPVVPNSDSSNPHRFCFMDIVNYVIKNEATTATPSCT